MEHSGQVRLGADFEVESGSCTATGAICPGSGVSRAARGSNAWRRPTLAKMARTSDPSVLQGNSMRRLGTGHKGPVLIHDAREDVRTMRSASRWREGQPAPMITTDPENPPGGHVGPDLSEGCGA
jgi:hypothetical protein